MQFLGYVVVGCLFAYLWLLWVLVAVPQLSLAAVSGAPLPCSAWASHYCGFSCCRAPALGVQL